MSLSDIKEVWRVEIQGALPGEESMNLDAALLNDAKSPDFVPMLRFYDWLNPTLTIGYGQPRSDIDFDALKLDGVDFAVRPTGGRAVLHWDEITYSIILPSGHPISESSVLESYHAISVGLADGLRRLGIEAEISRGESGGHKNPSCFSSTSRYEVSVGGKKLIGSAQRRKNGALLQQGSIPIGGEFRNLDKYLVNSEIDTELSKKAACIRDYIEKTPPKFQIYQIFAESLAEKLCFRYSD